MKRNDAEFMALVRRLQADEITRAQAAAEANISVQLLNAWLGRSGLNTSIPDKRKENAFVHEPGKAPLTPERKQALEDAVQRVFAGEISALAAAKANPDINYRTLAAKVRKLRLSIGQVVQFRASPVAKRMPAAE